MITTIDVETSYQKTEAGGFDPSPFNPNNILVSVGINDEYYFTNHSERIDEGCFHKIQKILDETKILIGHNITSASAALPVLEFSIISNDI